ncbi:MAG: hypothetical protein IKG85_08970 [Clostridia bacterium]|nr:hypothetical protein [Clostridia bacterium]
MSTIKTVTALALCVLTALTSGCFSGKRREETAVALESEAPAQQAVSGDLHPGEEEYEASLNRLNELIDELRTALDEAEYVLVETDEMGSPDFPEKDELIEAKADALGHLDYYSEVSGGFSPEHPEDVGFFARQTESYIERLRTAVDATRAALDNMRNAEPTAAPVPDEDEWITETCEYTDYDGYQMTVTVKYSRVYPSSMYSEVEALWASMGRGNALPTEGSWGFTHYTDDIWSLDCGTLSIESPRHNIYTAANDLYYMVGTVQFENHTPGWSFSESNPGKPKLYLISDGTSYTAYAVGRVFYKNTDQTFDAWIQVNPQMVGDRTAEIPFCVAFVEHYSPNYPDGRYRSIYEQEGFMKIRPENSAPIPMELRFAG